MDNIVYIKDYIKKPPLVPVEEEPEPEAQTIDALLCGKAEEFLQLVEWLKCAVC